MDRYQGRSGYRQNDHLGWINQAKMAETRHKRLDQMLPELWKGAVYMKMVHRPSARN